MLEKVTCVVDVLLHTVCASGTIVIAGVGLTVIVNVDEVGDAGQPLAVAVTVYVDVTGALVRLVAVRVYCPAVLIVGLSVVAPLTRLPPLAAVHW